MANQPQKNAQTFLTMLAADEIQEVYVRAPQRKKAASAAASTSELNKRGDTLEDMRKLVLSCTLCADLAKTRKNVVFGSGPAQAGLMFVGEAPGADEDEQGLPFVGMAGQLLTKIIESIGIRREDVFIANVLKCRPPGNRQPQPREITNCKPYLMKQIELIRPRIICALGTFAAQTLLETDAPISRLRGKFYDQGLYKIIPTFHPAYLLRNPSEKRKVWEDMKMIKSELGISS